jgi:hypothetical protein
MLPTETTGMEAPPYVRHRERNCDVAFSNYAVSRLRPTLQKTPTIWYGNRLQSGSKTGKRPVSLKCSMERELEASAKKHILP